MPVNRASLSGLALVCTLVPVLVLLPSAAWTHAFVSRSEPRKRFQPFEAMCSVQTVGSIAFRLALIGGGEGDAMLTFRALREWDVCGGVAVVEGAGGIVIDGQGNSIIFNRADSLCRGMVAANGTLARTLHGMLAKSLSENF